MPSHNLNWTSRWATAILLALLFFCLIFFLGYALYYTVNTFHYPPQADDYRLTLYHIKPFLDGAWQPKMLWSDVHPNPIHGALLILSSLYEDMRFTSLPYIGFIFLILKWALFSQVFHCIAKNHVSVKLKQFTVLWMGFILFSFSAPEQYFWNSVSIAHIYHALSALLLLSIVKSLESPSLARLALLLLVTTCFLITSRQFAIPWVYAALAGLALMSIVERSDFIPIFGRVIAALLLGLACEAMFYAAMDIDIYYSSTLQDLIESIQLNWSGRITDLVKFSFVEISLPLVYPWWLIKFASLDVMYVKIGVTFVSATFIYSVLLATINIKRNRGYLIALIAFIFTVITILATIAYRTDANTNWLINHTPRYIIFRNIGLIATIWTLLLSLNINKTIRAINSTLLLLLFLIFVSSQYFHLSHEREDRKRRLSNQRHLTLQLHFTYGELQKDPSVRQDQIKERYQKKYNRVHTLPLGDPNIANQRWKLKVISFWGDNNLNVFKADQTESQ